MATEYRVSFTAWPPGAPKSHRGERLTMEEDGARDQYKGLLSMKAPHELRPCGSHVWDPKLESREVVQNEWKDVG